MSTTTDQDRTLTFPNVVALRQAEAAIHLHQEQQSIYRKLSDLAHIAVRERIGRYLELGDETYVIEVIRGQESTWNVIRGSRMDYRGFYTLDEALLLAVELRNGGGPNDKGHIYAARMLGAGNPAGAQP